MSRLLILGLLLPVLVMSCGGESAENAEGPPPNPLLQPRQFNETAPEMAEEALPANPAEWLASLGGVEGADEESGDG